jgi:hypothetical protein
VKQKEEKEHDKANALSAALAVDGVAGRTKRTIHHVAPFYASPPTPTKKPRKPATPKKEAKTSSKPPKNSDEKDIDSQMAHPPTKKSSKSVHVDASGMEQFMLSIDKRLSMFQTQLMELQKCKTSLNLLLTSHVLSFV